MKGKLRIVSVLAVLLLMTVAMITVFASDGAEYTGTVAKTEQLLAIVDTKPTVTDKIAALDNVTAELAKVDPASEGYDAVAAQVDAKELELADLLIAEDATLTTAKDRLALLVKVNAYLAAHPFEDTREGDEAFSARVELIKTRIASDYLAECVAEVTPNAKNDKLDALVEYMAEYAPTVAETFAAEVEAESFATAKMYIALVERSYNSSTRMYNTAAMSAALRRHNALVKAHPFSEELEGFADYAATVAAKNAEYDEALAENKKIVHAGIHINDMDKLPVYNLDFTPSDDVTNPNNTTGQLTADKSNAEGATYSFAGPEFGKDGENGYYTVKFEVAKNHYRTDANIKGITGSFVFECDFTTFGHLPNDYDASNKLIWFENGTASVNPATTSEDWSQVYLSITGSGDIIASTRTGDVLVSGAIVPGEWTHISFVVDMETNNISVYVDYEYIRSYSIGHSSAGYTLAPTRVRIGCNPDVAGGEFSLDNVMLYQGYAPRDMNFNSTTLTEEEKFVFFASQLANPELDLVAKKEYYDNVSRLSSNYFDGVNYTTENPDVIEALGKIAAFDYKALLAGISEESLSSLNGIVGRLTSFNRSKASYFDRDYFLTKADNFMAMRGSYITDTEAINDIVKKMNKVRQELGEEIIIDEYVKYVSNFFAAASVDVMKVNFDAANDILRNLNTELASNPGFPEFKEAYERHPEMESIMRDKIIIDNSKRLLACIGFVLKYPEEEWDANFDALSTYVFMARELIRAGLYDVYYKNIQDLIAEFEPMGEYFVYKLRDNHINHLASELDRYDASTKYFERYGICIQLKEYIAENDMDLEDPEISVLVERLEGYILTLEEQKEEYADVLVSNTAAFVETCRALVGSIDYTTMKKVCDEASVYFYAMDVNDASVQDAISIYTRRCEEIEAIENVAVNFILAVEYLSVEDIDMLEALVDCASYLPDLDKSVSGVKEAYAAFESAMAAYDASVAHANSEINATIEYVTYTSNRKGLGAFVTAILNALTK